MIMFNITDTAGLVQRIMFAVAYLWYGTEAIRSARHDDTAAAAGALQAPASPPDAPLSAR